jgi:hypothetical protein
MSAVEAKQSGEACSAHALLSCKLAFAIALQRVATLSSVPLPTMQAAYLDLLMVA